jgi:seryl-tRNA synthetase
MYEQFADLAFELAKQSPTVLLLGAAVYEFRRREMTATEKLDKSIKAHAKEIKTLNESYAAELKEEREDHKDEIKVMNDKYMEHDLKSNLSLDNVSDALNSFLDSK